MHNDEEQDLYKKFVDIINEFSDQSESLNSDSNMDASQCNGIIVKVVTIIFIDVLKKGLKDNSYVECLLDFIKHEICNEHENS